MTHFLWKLLVSCLCSQCDKDKNGRFKSYDKGTKNGKEKKKTLAAKATVACSEKPTKTFVLRQETQKPGKKKRKKKKLLKSDFKTKAFETLFQNNSQLRVNLAFKLTDTLRT